MAQKPHLLVAVLMAALSWSGCAGRHMAVREPPEEYEVLGPTEGSATGSMLLVYPPAYFIPVWFNDRTERAYRDALENVPGATGLINVTIQESWFWWVIGTAKTITIKGDAIRETRR